MLGAELLGRAQSVVVDVGGDDSSSAEGPGQFDVEQPDETAPEHQHTVPWFYFGLAQAPDHGSERLDEGTLFVGHFIRQLHGSFVHALAGDPQVLGKTARGEVVLRMKGFAGRVESVQAVVTLIAGHVMGREHPVSDLELLDIFAHFDHVPGQLVSQDQRGLLDPVPLHYIAAADPARPDLDQQIPIPDFGNGLLFHPDIPVVVVHPYLHRFLAHHLAPLPFSS